MSTGGGGGFGSGDFYGSSPTGGGGDGGGGGGLGVPAGGLGAALGGLGGLLGAMGGGPQPAGPVGNMGPRGHFGLWPSCGCGTIILVIGVMFVVCGGCLQVINQ